MITASERMYRSIVLSVSDYAIFMLDRNGLVLSWNLGAEQIKGYMADEIIGRNFEVFYREADRAADLPRRNLDEAVRTGRISTEGWRLRRDGSSFWANITIDAIYVGDGSFHGFVKVTRDLTEQHALMERIAYQANHDGLTGLLNRSGLFDRIEAELASKRSLAIHYLDLDRFKPINDRLGHAAGDVVLQTVATRLGELAYGQGLAGRIGGDEFVVAQFRTDTGDQHSNFSEQIVHSLCRPITIGRKIVSIGTSIGVANAPEDGSDISTLLQIADTALYKAKFSRRSGAART